MHEALHFGGRRVPREVVERALALFDEQVGLDQAIAEAEANRPRMTPEELDQAIERIQQLVAKYVPDDVSLVDELIAGRRAEAAREGVGARRLRTDGNTEARRRFRTCSRRSGYWRGH